MADETSSQERTESATPRRREQARSEGRVARSTELSGAAALLGGALMLSAFGAASLSGYAVRFLRASTAGLSGEPLMMASATALLRAGGTGFVLALLPFAVALMATVTLVNLAQTRGALSWTPIRPKLSHVNPATNLKRILGPEALFSLFKSVAKLLALGIVTWLVLARSWPQLTALSQTGPGDTAATIRDLLFRLAVMTGITYVAVAFIDYGFQLLRHEKSLRMTRQDIVREHRESEGDPLIKARVMSIMRARARQRMLQQVPSADVVVVNPTQIAVALKYDLDAAPAPIVVAMGERKLAQRIRDLARASGVPVLENKPVARALLATAVVGKPIPPALYAAVAEILAFVYRQRGTLPGGGRLPSEGRAL